MIPDSIRLLLIEDNPGDARLLRELLAEQTALVIDLTHVQCMRDAEKCLAHDAADIILLDLGLPDTQGLEAVRRIRAAAPRVPLVMLTVLDDESLAAHALQEGAQDYLIKGQIDTRGLVRALRYALDRTTAEKALQGSELRFRQAARKIENLNRVHAVLSGITALIVRVRDRSEFFREACRVAIEQGHFVMAWIGIVDRPAGLVKRVASSGDVKDFFDAAPRALIECTPDGHGFVSRAIREMKPLISRDVSNDPGEPMKEALAQRGIDSIAVIPLIVRGEAIGMLALYAAETDGFFDDGEMKLLVELADNVSVGLEHIQKAVELDYLAYYDPLTGLANRALFLDRVGQKVLAAADQNLKVAVLALDIERFKTVNEALGRKAGDDLLGQVAERLVAAGHPPSLFARVAGDHFAALRDGSRLARVAADHFAIVSTQAQNEEQIAQFTELTLKQCFTPPFLIGDAEVRISASIGIAVFPRDGADAESLLSNATSALRKAKARGERYAFYTQEMNERSTARLTLENRLRQAVEKREFVLHYQPKVDVATRRILAVEALIRWQSPELGLVPPMEFIPLMEETGMILEVGAWALARASTDHSRWTRMGLAAPRVAVNVSPVQLRKSDFLTTVESVIGHGTHPPGIDLEITESVMMEDVEGNIRKLRAVEDLGVSIAIDDFGTGYSSLAYLVKLPLKTLKIDRSFIVAMIDDPDTMTLVQMIISLAHSLRLRVVAEGVELEEQAAILRRLNCDEMQGYLYSKALPFDALTALLQQQAENDVSALGAAGVVMQTAGGIS